LGMQPGGASGGGPLVDIERSDRGTVLVLVPTGGSADRE
jgi:hypothetical protein